MIRQSSWNHAPCHGTDHRPLSLVSTVMLEGSPIMNAAQARPTLEAVLSLSAARVYELLKLNRPDV